MQSNTNRTQETLKIGGKSYIMEFSFSTSKDISVESYLAFANTLKGVDDTKKDFVSGFALLAHMQVYLSEVFNKSLRIHHGQIEVDETDSLIEEFMMSGGSLKDLMLKVANVFCSAPFFKTALADIQAGQEMETVTKTNKTIKVSPMVQTENRE